LATLLPAKTSISLRELTLPGDVLILALRRQGEVLVPNGDTRIEQGDNLSLVGSLECTEAARDMFTENLKVGG